MTYPKITINKNKLKENVEILVDICKRDGISPGGVTKVFSGNSELVNILIEGGIEFLADSRIENLEEFKDIPLAKLMLRLPMLSEVEKIVEYADMSLNSELLTIKKLSEVALEKEKVHKIILMIDLGDLREGIFEESEVYELIKDIIKLKGIKLIGLGTNLTCHGGVIPTHHNLKRLSEIKEKIEEKFKLNIEILSGGNSSSLHLLEKNDMPAQINQLRLGESLILGRETAYGNRIKGTHSDVFQLITELIEIREKPSIPIGEIGLDAFGRKPTFIDKGKRKRGICAIGKQDIDIEDLIAVDKNINIIGQSSDHLIVDLTDSKDEYKLGDKVKFDLNYGGILKLMTSKYVCKEIK